MPENHLSLAGIEKPGTGEDLQDCGKNFQIYT